jgi:acyl-coenzyme A synthetase/AMP-(fatty) acid ligase
MDEILNSSENQHVVKNNNPYIVFLNILKNLSCKQTSIILDANFSDEEIASLDLEVNIEATYVSSPDKSINNIRSFISFLQTNKNNLYIDIYTSGTTGKPQKITQPLSNIIRSVKIDTQNADDVWAFAYNPTHFAGLQVFFQALFNQNSMIYCFHGNFETVAADLYKYSVNRLSCTPTFIKMLIPFLTQKLPLVKTLTFGGEKFDQNVKTKLLDIFPSARIVNVYASTEGGSLLATDGEYFKIPNRYTGLIKIDSGKHLLIHKSLTGVSNRLDIQDEWYNTGDLVEYIDDLRFKIIGRSSDIINVGGYKVHPSEVEQVIRQVKDVKDLIVYGRKNSLTGSVIAADIIVNSEADKDTVKKKIIEIAKNSLQEWKMPRILNFVDKFELTHTGKIKRNK